MSELTLSEFADRVGQLMPVIMKEFMRNQGDEFHKMKITMPQFFVMEYLYRSGESRMGDIAKFLNVTTAAITGTVDKLVRELYVIRISDPEDRRIVKIRLTTKGTNVVKDVMGWRRQVSMKMFGMITQEEREQYISILTRIKDKIQEQG